MQFSVLSLSSRVCHHVLTEIQWFLVLINLRGEPWSLGSCPSLPRGHMDMDTSVPGRFQVGTFHSPRCVSGISIGGRYCWAVGVKVTAAVLFAPSLTPLSLPSLFIKWCFNSFSTCEGRGQESVSFCVDSYHFGSTEPVKYGTCVNIFRWRNNETDNHSVAKSKSPTRRQLKKNQYSEEHWVLSLTDVSSDLSAITEPPFRWTTGPSTKNQDQL